MGEAGEGRNITHQQKKLNDEELLYFRDRFDIPLSDSEASTAPFYKPDNDSDEIKYIIIGTYFKNIKFHFFKKMKKSTF